MEIWKRSIEWFYLNLFLINCDEYAARDVNCTRVIMGPKVDVHTHTVKFNRLIFSFAK